MRSCATHTRPSPTSVPDAPNPLALARGLRFVRKHPEQLVPRPARAPIRAALNPPLEPSVELPEGVSEAELRSFLESIRVTDSPPATLRRYVRGDFWRFVRTWDLVRELDGTRPRARRKSLLHDDAASRVHPPRAHARQLLRHLGDRGAGADNRAPRSSNRRDDRYEPALIDLQHRGRSLSVRGRPVRRRSLLRDHRAPDERSASGSAGDQARPQAGRRARPHDAERQPARQCAQDDPRGQHLRPVFGYGAYGRHNREYNKARAAGSS